MGEKVRVCVVYILTTMTPLLADSGGRREAAGSRTYADVQPPCSADSPVAYGC